MSSFVAFLSGADQYGRWVPDEEVTASAYLGGSTVDFSQALFEHPVITIRSTAFWGSVTLIVPPNVKVEQDGAAILGGFGDVGGVWQNTLNDLPQNLQNPPAVTIRAVGTALMGTVKAVVNPRAAPAQLLSHDEVVRILREVPAEPSTTVQDFMGQALHAHAQAQAQAQQARQASEQAMAQALAQAMGAAAGANAGLPVSGAPGGVPMAPVPAPMGAVPGPDPRQALLQGLVTAQAQSGDPRAALLQQVLNAQTATQAQAQPVPQQVAPAQGHPVSAGGNLQGMD